MNGRKHPKRRTFLQDRFEILLKRQESGEATFNELTELDEIVNRDPEIREMVIRETLLVDGDDFNTPENDTSIKNTFQTPGVMRRSLFERLKSFIARIFNSQFLAAKTGSLIICA